MTIAADPIELVTVAQRLHGLGSDIRRLSRASSMKGGGTGDREADAALDEFQARWARQLDLLARQVAAYAIAGQVVASAFEEAGG